MKDNIETSTFSNRSRVKELRIEHRDLDLIIDKLAEAPDIDQVLIKRLKKKRLLLKDMIVKIESELIPDLNA